MDNGKIKIAQIIGNAGNGGVEACILNYYKFVDREKIQFDFFVSQTSDLINEKDINELGGNVIITPKYTNLIKYISFLIKTFKANNYDIVHSNLNSLSVFPLFAAQVAGVKIRIAHSHSTTNKKEFLRNIVKNFLKLFSKVFANKYFACSKLAGIWLFGKRTFKKGEVIIINNAIDTDRFKFDSALRKTTRMKYGIDEKTILLGNVGRLCRQKNQLFLLNILNKLDLTKYKLLILGQGELNNVLKCYAEEKKISDNVIFVDSSSKPEDFYNAFDIFLLPSLYEGLPVSGVEAQANSLPCIFSTNITKEVKATDDVVFLNIDFGVEPRISAINKLILNGRKKQAINSNFDINFMAKKLQNYYISFINNL